MSFKSLKTLQHTQPFESCTVLLDCLVLYQVRVDIDLSKMLIAAAIFKFCCFSRCFSSVVFPLPKIQTVSPLVHGSRTPKIRTFSECKYRFTRDSSVMPTTFRRVSFCDRTAGGSIYIYRPLCPGTSVPSPPSRHPACRRSSSTKYRKTPHCVPLASCQFGDGCDHRGRCHPASCVHIFILAIIYYCVV